jgi:hypothetical protein
LTPAALDGWRPVGITWQVGVVIYIYIVFIYYTWVECTQAEPTRQEHLVRANRPTQAEPTLRLRPSRTLSIECYNFRTRPAVASSYIEVAITPDQQLQLHQTSSCNHIFCNHTRATQQLHPHHTNSCNYKHTSSCNHFVYIF